MMNNDDDDDNSDEDNYPEYYKDKVLVNEN